MSKEVTACEVRRPYQLPEGATQDIQGMEQWAAYTSAIESIPLSADPYVLRCFTYRAEGWPCHSDRAIAEISGKSKAFTHPLAAQMDR